MHAIRESSIRAVKNETDQPSNSLRYSRPRTYSSWMCRALPRCTSRCRMCIRHWLMLGRRYSSTHLRCRNCDLPMHVPNVAKKFNYSVFTTLPARTPHNTRSLYVAVFRVSNTLIARQSSTKFHATRQYSRSHPHIHLQCTTS